MSIRYRRVIRKASRNMTPQQALATKLLLVALGIIILLIGIFQNFVIDKTLQTYSNTTTGIVTGDTESRTERVKHRKRHRTTYSTLYLYQADVTYEIENTSYTTTVFDSNKSGADPYFKKGDTVTVNYIPDQPEKGLVIRGNNSLKKQYSCHLSGGMIILCGLMVKGRKRQTQ